MEIRQLRHFIAVVENGSLGRAAEVLGISEPALSKSIRTLEAHVGVQLLDRSPRGMRPTVYGTAMHRHARAVLSEVSSALGELRELRGVAKGVVRVGAQPSLAGMLLPGTIAALQALRPGVKVVAQVATTDLLTLLRDGDLDLILVTLAPTLDALLAARWVLPREPDPLRLLFEGAFARRGAGPPRVDIETGSETLIRACVERHGHASLLPRALVQDALDAGRMHQVALADFTLSRRIGVLRRRGTSLPPAAVALLEALRAESRRPRAHG